MSAMHYVGDGSFFIGVPARDLTASEATQCAAVITGSPLYEAVSVQAAPAAQAAEAVQGEAAPTESAGKRRKGD